MPQPDPFQHVERRPHTDGPFDAAEVRLANRNSGILLETLRHDVTPAGMHYLLNHFLLSDDNAPHLGHDIFADSLESCDPVFYVAGVKGLDGKSGHVEVSGYSFTLSG